MALTKAHNRMIEGAAVNVKDFGAVGDGVTDDTAAIQAAIDAAISNGNEIVIPVGQYKVTSTLLADHTKISDKNGISIRGLGASFRDSRIVYSGTGYAMDCSGTGDESGTTITRFKLSNFSIFGNQTTTATGALDISRTFLVELDRMELGSFYSSSAIVLNAQNVFSLAVNNCHIYCAESDSDLSLAKGDCVIVGSPDPDSWSSSNLVFTGGLLQRGDYGLRVNTTHVGSLDNLTIDNVSIGNNRENNLRIPDVTGRVATVSLRNVHFENAGRTGASTIALKDSVYINDIDSLCIDNCHSNGANVHYNLIDNSSVNIFGGSMVTATLWQPTLTADTGISITAPTKFCKAFIGPVNIVTSQITTPFSIASSVDYVYNTNQEHDTAYTPALTLGSGSVTYDTQDGSYSRIGNLVFFEAHIDLASVSTPSGALQINLPVTPTTDAAYRSALAVYYENLDVNPAADLQLIVEIAGNTTTGVFKFARDVSAGQNVAASLTATSVIVVQGSYRV